MDILQNSLMTLSTLLVEVIFIVLCAIGICIGAVGILATIQSIVKRTIQTYLDYKYQKEMNQWMLKKQKSRDEFEG